MKKEDLPRGGIEAKQIEDFHGGRWMALMTIRNAGEHGMQIYAIRHFNLPASIVSPVSGWRLGSRWWSYSRSSRLILLVTPLCTRGDRGVGQTERSEMVIG